MENKSEYLEVAIKAALEAGKILEKYFESEILKELKEDDSIVTKADRESEEVIKNILLKSFPEYSILGEETGHIQNHIDYRWHIDPIDGTRNFSNGVALFAVSIALAYKDEIILGVVYNPITKSLFYAEKGQGAYLNDQKIYISKDDITHSIISSGKSRKELDRKLCRNLMHDLPEQFPGLTIRDIGTSALDLALVARGGFEATIELGLHSYDFAAGSLLVQEAGGIITKLDGTEWKFPENTFLASNGLFHDKLVEEIKRQKMILNIE